MRTIHFKDILTRAIASCISQLLPAQIFCQKTIT